MASKCKKCGTLLGEEDPQLDENCIVCFADDWGEIVEDSPMASPNILLKEKRQSA